MREIDQFTVPCAVYRGGTSRGLFFHEKDLPRDKRLRDHIFYTGIGVPDETQVNGLGGGNSHTSKIAIISPSQKPGVDVEYTFVQVGLKGYVLDEHGTCGNLMAAVGAFAIDEGLAGVEEESGIRTVTVYNTNIGKVLQIQVPVARGAARVKGDFRMPGLTHPGAKIIVDIMQPGGGKTGATLPAGVSTRLDLEAFSGEATLTDLVNPMVYVAARDLQRHGGETMEQLSGRADLLQKLEEIRVYMAVASGIAPTMKDAALHYQAIPKIAVVSEPRDYVTRNGAQVRADDIDILAWMVSMGKVHKSFAVSGLFNLAASCLLQGTIPNRFVRRIGPGREHVVRIGHPGGVAEVRVRLTPDGEEIESVGLERTARRIMKGELYVPVLD